MGISPDGSIITGAGVQLFALLALRAAVTLEQKGLKFTHGSMTAKAMKRFGCKRKDVLVKLDAAILHQSSLVKIENEMEARIDCDRCAPGLRDRFGRCASHSNDLL